MGTPHEAIAIVLPAITPGMIGEGKTLKYLNHNLPTVEHKGKRARKITSDEDRPTQITFPPSTTATLD